ncbi:hypothetical protein JXB12_04980 [candidate division KSB1 bacterium]|nr:hypothetical protein [candidate division KSB1 bacterium]
MNLATKKNLKNAYHCRRWVEDAFLFVNSAIEYSNCAVVNRVTGEIYYQSDMNDIDEFPDDVDSDDYVEIPYRNDLDLGRDLVYDFAREHAPYLMDAVINIFRARGAYARFKDLLASKDLLDKWYKYEDDRTKAALREWCEENDLKID